MQSTRDLFRLLEHEPRAYQRGDDSRTAQREEELAALAVDEHDSDHRHQEIHRGEDDIAPVRLHVGKAGLNQDRRIIADDRIHAGQLVAGQDDAGQDEGDDVLAVQQRLAAPAGRPPGLGLFGRGGFFHFPHFDFGLLRAAGAEQRRPGGIHAAAAEEPARRLGHDQAAQHEEHARRQRYPEDAPPGEVLGGEQFLGIAQGLARYQATC